MRAAGKGGHPWPCHSEGAQHECRLYAKHFHKLWWTHSREERKKERKKKEREREKKERKRERERERERRERERERKKEKRKKERERKRKKDVAFSVNVTKMSSIKTTHKIKPNKNIKNE